MYMFDHLSYLSQCVESYRYTNVTIILYMCDYLSYLFLSLIPSLITIHVCYISPPRG